MPTIADDMYYEVKEFLDVIESGAKESAVNTHQRSLEVLELVDRAGKIIQSK